MDTPPSDPQVGLAKDRTSIAKFRTQLALDLSDGRLPRQIAFK
jgi:hypothetical protein